MSIELNELSQKAMGGTELMQYRLNHYVDSDLLKDYQIIASRVRKIDANRKPILWLHDLPGDPESEHLRDGGWERFEKLVFVSHWQQAQYNLILGVPYSAGVVLRNAIEPIEDHEKPKPKPLKLIYTSTPHRGLDILYAVFDALSKEFDDIELDVYSSFKLYGWPERDEPYKQLIQQLMKHPKINYYKSVPNKQIREALKNAHIFAYPSTWPETSCLCLIEAMSAGCLCVHSSLAALPETSSNLTMMYGYNDDRQAHADEFYRQLKTAIITYKDTIHRENVKNLLKTQKALANGVYSWYNRKYEWENLLKRLNDENSETP